jgi:hypothetical protein
LPRSFSHDGKAWVTVEFAGIRHTPLPPREAGNVALAAEIGALQAEIARLARPFGSNPMFSHSQLAGEMVGQK